MCHLTDGENIQDDMIKDYINNIELLGTISPVAEASDGEERSETK